MNDVGWPQARGSGTSRSPRRRLCGRTVPLVQPMRSVTDVMVSGSADQRPRALGAGDGVRVRGDEFDSPVTTNISSLTTRTRHPRPELVTVVPRLRQWRRALGAGVGGRGGGRGVGFAGTLQIPG